MNGMMPKFLEKQEIPLGYYEIPDPYEYAPSCNINLTELYKYAKYNEKKIADLTREEIMEFSYRKGDNGNAF